MKRRPKPTKGKSNSNNEKVNDLAPFRENSAERISHDQSGPAD